MHRQTRTTLPSDMDKTYRLSRSPTSLKAVAAELGPMHCARPSVIYARLCVDQLFRMQQLEPV